MRSSWPGTSWRSSPEPAQPDIKTRTLVPAVRPDTRGLAVNVAKYIKLRIRRVRLRPVWALSLLSIAVIALTARFLPAQAVSAPTDPAFEEFVKPFLAQNCVRCHNVDNSTAGIRVDLLDAKFEDNQIKAWDAIRRRISGGTMPPKGQPQPTSADRQQMVEWIARALEVARLRPAPKNGLVRRLTVAQYRNTLRELLLLDDDLTAAFPPTPSPKMDS